VAAVERPVDPHKILGVSPESSLEELKSAFRKKALEHHPDTGGSAETFIALKRAYDSIVKRRVRRGR
jgi:curved DNA-binding protein CbpA